MTANGERIRCLQRFPLKRRRLAFRVYDLGRVGDLSRLVRVNDALLNGQDAYEWQFSVHEGLKKAFNGQFG